jgi:hypothetical protein
VALAVARQAVHDGVAAVPESALERAIRATMWTPDYPTFVPA